MPDYLKFDPSTKRILNKWLSVDPSVVGGLSEILEISRTVYEALTIYHRVNDAGNAVIEMSQAEKDALNAEIAQAAIDAENARINAIDDTLVETQTITLPKVEAAINNINNLADAKVFLKRLCRYLAKHS
jgi:hypothetical protein